MPRTPKKKTGKKGAAKKPRSVNRGLTLKQQLFVDAYLGEANGNATEAARIAGYASPRIQGSENLTKPDIRAAIDSRLAQSAMSSAEVLARLSEHASGSIGDVITLTEDGGYKLDLLKAKASGKIKLIKKLSPTKDGIGIEMYDAQAALDKLGRHHGIFTDKANDPFGGRKPEDLTDEELSAISSGKGGG